MAKKKSKVKSLLSRAKKVAKKAPKKKAVAKKKAVVKKKVTKKKSVKKVKPVMKKKLTTHSLPSTAEENKIVEDLVPAEELKEEVTKSERMCTYCDGDLEKIKSNEFKCKKCGRGICVM